MRLPRNKYANHAVDFINNLTHTGDYSGLAFDLRNWQKQILRLIFGLRNGDKRQIEDVFLMLPSGNGKTELCAAIAVYCLFTFPPGQQIISAAADRSQAALVFNAAKQMIENDPELLELCEIVDSQKRIVIADRHSFYVAVSSEARLRQGLAPSVVLFDEINCQPNDILWKTLKSKLTKRRNPLWIGITTAGRVDPNHVAWQEYDYSRKIRGRIENGEWIDEGSIDNPSYLPVLYGTDEDEPCRCGKGCDAGWQCEAVWHRCNKALGDFKNLAKMRDEFAVAREIPSRQNWTRREHLNTWLQQATRWLDMAAFDECDQLIDPNSLLGTPCWCGLDLAPVHDLSCLSMLFVSNGFYQVITHSWCNEAELKQRSRDGLPYDQWERLGFLKATPGSSTNYETIRHDILKLNEKFRIQLIATDRNSAYQLAQQLNEQDGVPVQWHSQGFGAMSPPMRFLEKLIIDRQIRFGANPLQRWCFDNTVIVENSYGDIRPDHDKKTERMDAACSLIMAIGGLLAQPEQQESVYENRGCLVF